MPGMKKVKITAVRRTEYPDLMARYIPKGTDFSELTDEMLAEIEWKHNHRPRKSLGYRTPLEYCKQLFIFDF